MYDGTTKEGRNNIAKYYDVLEEWKTLENKNNDFLTEYYKLLFLVKKTSTNDTVWISFVEGLHRHAAIILTLLCSKFDYDNNTLLSKSLDITNFDTADIPNFKLPSNNDTHLTPEQLLNNINNDGGQLVMLQKLFHAKVYIINDTKCNINKLTEELKLRSAIISHSKLNSAQKTISVKLAIGLQEIMTNSSDIQRKDKKNQPIFNQTINYIKQKTPDAYNKLILQTLNNDDREVLNYPEMLQSQKWIDFINDPFNPIKRNAFFGDVCPKSKGSTDIKLQPPYALYWTNLVTNDTYVQSGKKSLNINSCNMNGYLLIPIIVTNLIEKLHPDKLTLKINIIHYLTRVVYGMRKTQSVLIHPAIYHYCAAAPNTIYNQGFEGEYKIIPVTEFIVTLFNACFMFDDDKSRNLLILAFKKFDLDTTIGDTTFMTILSKFTLI